MRGRLSLFLIDSPVVLGPQVDILNTKLNFFQDMFRNIPRIRY